jgi:hypothetical protein
MNAQLNYMIGQRRQSLHSEELWLLAEARVNAPEVW